MIQEKRRRVYRNPSPLLVTAITLAVDALGAVVLIQGLGAEHSSVSATVFIALLIVLFTPVSIRLAWAGIFASQTGIHVRNVFSNLDLKWEEVEQFDIGRSGLFPKVCRIHTWDGRALRAFGIQESNYASFRKLAIAGRLVEELNKELAHYGGAKFLR
jgi:hypothetical protein